MIDGCGISCEIYLRWLLMNLTDVMSTLRQWLGFTQETSYNQANVDTHLYHHMASLGHNKFIDTVINHWSLSPVSQSQPVDSTNQVMFQCDIYPASLLPIKFSGSLSMVYLVWPPEECHYDMQYYGNMDYFTKKFWWKILFVVIHFLVIRLLPISVHAIISCAKFSIDFSLNWEENWNFHIWITVKNLQWNVSMVRM